jgi:uncharacterized protein (DUF427 family)
MSDPITIRTENGMKRVRVMLGGEIVADTTRPLLVWENPYFPNYYFPEADLRTDLLVETGETVDSPGLEMSTRFAVKAGSAEGVAYAFHDRKNPELEGHIAFVWRTMDHWFEENEEVYTHARDPNTRIDILPSDRRVRVVIEGVTVADSSNGSFLFETGLPPRYYLPKTDVRMDLMAPNGRSTACPYKGNARYWSATVNGQVHENILWGYDTPLPESQKIAGLVSFYNEKVDIYLDEILQERPVTKFS